MLGFPDVVLRNLQQITGVCDSLVSDYALGVANDVMGAAYSMAMHGWMLPQMWLEWLSLHLIVS